MVEVVASISRTLTLLAKERRLFVAKFMYYFPPNTDLESLVFFTFRENDTNLSSVRSAMSFLQPIREKDTVTYEHSLRVCLLAGQIGKFIHLDPKALLFAGLMHDVGKAQTPLSTLQKTEGWTEKDTSLIMKHVMDGYRLIRDRFDFSAEIVLWHHKFQAKGYPKKLPHLLHDYSEGTKVMIPWYGRMLSLADTFDALHRVNDKHGDKPLTGEDIKQKMITYNKDQKILVEDLFKEGIFTTNIFQS